MEDSQLYIDNATVILSELEGASKELMLSFIIVAVVGVAGNVFSGAVWSSDPDKSSTSFFLATLAFCDSLFLVSKTIGLLLLMVFGIRETIFHRGCLLAISMSISKLAMYSTAFVTVTVSINRCIALFKPLRYVSLCSRFKAKLTVLVIMVLSTVATIPDVLKNIAGINSLSLRSLEYLGSYKTFEFVCFLMESIAVYGVPCSLLLCVNVTMFVEQRRHTSQFVSDGLRATKRRPPFDSVIALSVLYMITISVAYGCFNCTLGKLRYLVSFEDISLCMDIAWYSNACCKILLYCIVSNKFNILRRGCACRRRTARSGSKSIEVNPDEYAEIPWWLAPTEAEKDESNT